MDLFIDEQTIQITAKNHHTAESPIWDPSRRVFFYTDIEGGALHKFDPKNGKTTTWQIGSIGDGDKNGQMIGGIALNIDHSLIILLENGPNAGVNYFNPDEAFLLNIPDSWPEIGKKYNRPNDVTIVNIGGTRMMIYGTMSKKWVETHDGSFKHEGGFYILDNNMVSHKITFEGNIYPGTVISNGLADGGINQDGTTKLFWAESVGKNTEVNVYTGNLDPKNYTVRDVRVFLNHHAMSDGHKACPDGANMININGKEAYAVSVLQRGEIRAFDPLSGKKIASIKLPAGLTNNTKFAIGEDSEGKNMLFVTSVNFDYGKGDIQDSLNGYTILVPLPPEISIHHASIQTTDYPSMEKMRSDKTVIK